MLLVLAFFISSVIYVKSDTNERYHDACSLQPKKLKLRQLKRLHNSALGSSAHRIGNYWSFVLESGQCLPITSCKMTNFGVDVQIHGYVSYLRISQYSSVVYADYNMGRWDQKTRSCLQWLAHCHGGKKKSDHTS